MHSNDAQENNCEVAVTGGDSERILVQSVSLYQILGTNPVVKLVLCLTPVSWRLQSAEEIVLSKIR